MSLSLHSRAFAVALVLLAFVAATAMAQPSPAGRMTCTVEGGQELAVGVTREVQCVYVPVSGARARFQGTIGRFGPDADNTGKRVLVWLVIAPPGTEATDLSGTYVRTDPAKPIVDPDFANALIGGTGGSIALQPPGGNEQVPGNAAMTILELKLAVIKT